MKILSLFIIVTLMTACGKNHDENSYDEIYNPEDTDMVMSALGVINSALNDQEQVNQLAYNIKNPSYKLFELFIIPTAYAGNECNRNRFSPAVGLNSSCSGTSEDKTVMVNYNGCNPAGYNFLNLYGNVKLLFDSPATCNDWINGGDSLPTSGSVVRTTNNYQRISGRLVVTMDSSDRENYNKTLIGGGVITAFAPSYHEIHILGITRIGKWNNQEIFNHSVSTPAPLFVTGSKENNNRLISSGGIQIDDNKKLYSLNATVNNLTFVSSCCYPVGGNLNFSRRGSKTGNLTINFTNSCGTVSGSIDGAFFSTTLNSCE